MKTEIKTSLGYGFVLIEKNEGKVLSTDAALDSLQQLQRLDDLGESPSLHHIYCTRLLEFVEKSRKTFGSVGQSVKITSSIPITAIRYTLASKPSSMVYRFLNTIFHKGQCSFDHTTGFKLKDYINTEFKTLFNVTYELEMNEGSEPFMKRRLYSITNRINDVITTFKNVDHPAFVLQAIKGLVPLVPNQPVRGRFFETTLTLKEGGNFAIFLKSNKPTGDSVRINYEEGRFHVTLLQSVLKVDLVVDDQLLFEILYCINQECSHNTPVNKTMGRLKEYKHHKRN